MVEATWASGVLDKFLEWRIGHNLWGWDINAPSLNIFHDAYLLEYNQQIQQNIYIYNILKTGPWSAPKISKLEYDY